MKKFGSGRSTLATVIAAAVVIAVASTGGAVAGGLVTSAKIKNNTIKSIDVKNNALTGADVADGTLSNADLAPNARSSAYSTFHDAPVNISTQVTGTDPTVLTLSVPAAGSYTITATTWLFGFGTTSPARCSLAAGGDTDFKGLGVGANGESTALQVVHTFPTAGVVTLKCYSFGASIAANDSKITAVKVDHLTNTAS